MSINVSLPPDMENRVRAQVSSGLYGSPSEVIGEALRLFESFQAMQAASMAALKADIDKGVADIEAGRLKALSVDAIKQRGRKALAASKNAA